MSTFNVHEWNYNRRLAALNEGMYPKRGEKYVDLTAEQPRAFVRAGDLGTAKRHGQVLKDASGKFHILSTGTTGGVDGGTYGKEGDPFYLIAFMDADNLDTFVNVLGNPVFWVGQVSRGTDIGSDIVKQFGGIAAQDISNKVPKVGTPGQPGT